MMREGSGETTVAQKGTGGLEGALQWLDALNVATKITTVISLAALAVIVAFLLSSQWLSGRRAQISQAIDKGDDSALAALLGHVDVPLEGLSPDQKFAMGRDQSRQRFWQKMVWQSFLFAGFMALLVLVWALVQPKRAPREPMDPVALMELLKMMSAERRAEGCAKLQPTETCAKMVALLADVPAQPPASPQVQAAVETSLKSGQLSTTLATVLRQRVQLTAGDAKGWDVSIRWCEGLFARRNEARAMATARALAQTPGERIAPGVTLGRIEVTRTATRPGGGAFVAGDGTAGEAEAAAAIRATLAARGADHYRVQQVIARSRWQIEVYECESNVGVRRGQRL